MACQMDEDILERRLAESNRFDFVTEPVDDFAYKLMTAREFDTDCAVDQRAPHTHSASGELITTTSPPTCALSSPGGAIATSWP